MKNNIFVEVLNEATKNRNAVGAVNIFNYTTASAAISAANEVNINVIIQTSTGTVKHFGAAPLFDMINSIRKYSDIKVAIHLDHCREMELAKECIKAGWDSVMMDFSHLPLKENINKTKEMADFAHERNVAIEGEIGIISGVEEDIVSECATGAKYEETMEFIEKSGIDAIAPAIGTAHGVYQGIPKLDFELVEKLGSQQIPIVIHGGSGLSAETFTKLIQLGGRKVNISTLVKTAYMEGIRELIKAEKDYSPIDFDEQVKNIVAAEKKKHLKVFAGFKNSF